MLVGVVMVAVGCGDEQAQTQSSRPSQLNRPAHTPKPTPAVISVQTPLIFRNESGPAPTLNPKVVIDADFLKRITEPTPAAMASPLSWAEVLEQNPDPKVVTDADFLKRITETKLPWRVKDNASGMEMLLVPPGNFVMGISPGDTEWTCTPIMDTHNNPM